MLKTETINKIFEIWQKDHRNDPIIELNYKNNYTLLVAVILSAQSTDKGVNKATEELFKITEIPEKMLKLGEGGLKKYIKTIGLYNSKAKNIIAMSEVLVKKFNSKVPGNFDDLVSLPGVGRKTANVVLNCAFDIPAIGVDTHVFRVSNRIGIVKENNVLDTEKSLEKVIPQKWKKYVNHWMVLHGRYICKAKKPLCEQCNINEYCEYFKKTKK
jgi:endonuclease-3